jgi:hypothetical protein
VVANWLGRWLGLAFGVSVWSAGACEEDVSSWRLSAQD